jgi:transposase
MLHRQHGIRIPDNTLSDWVGQASELFRLVYGAMLARQRRKSYLQVDETPGRYLDPHIRGRSQQGYFWVYADPLEGEVLFQWSQGRGRDAPREFLGDYRGILQADGFSAYTALVRSSDGALALAHCWAHARREIREASSEAPRAAAWLLRQIQLMYEIEAELRQRRAGPLLRAAARASRTAMILERLFKGMTRLRARQLPGGAMAKALDYALARQEGLRLFLGDGRLEIDTNIVENAIRPCAIGRKNWLFVGHPQAGDRAAIFYSLMASCRLHDINPLEYLTDVLNRLPSATSAQIEPFIPSQWAKARRLAAR